MKKVLGLLMGATIVASIPAMADELVLRDRELDTVTAGDTATAYSYIYTYTNVNGKESVNESYSNNGHYYSNDGNVPSSAKNPAAIVQVNQHAIFVLVNSHLVLQSHL